MRKITYMSSKTNEVVSTDVGFESAKTSVKIRMELRLHLASNALISVNTYLQKTELLSETRLMRRSKLYMSSSPATVSTNTLFTQSCVRTDARGVNFSSLTVSTSIGSTSRSLWCKSIRSHSRSRLSIHSPVSCQIGESLYVGSWVSTHTTLSIASRAATSWRRKRRSPCRGNTASCRRSRGFGCCGRGFGCCGRGFGCCSRGFGRCGRASCCSGSRRART
jgi:hypothetical protein